MEPVLKRPLPRELERLTDWKIPLDFDFLAVSCNSMVLMQPDAKKPLKQGQTSSKTAIFGRFFVFWQLYNHRVTPQSKKHQILGVHAH